VSEQQRDENHKKRDRTKRRIKNLDARRPSPQTQLGGGSNPCKQKTVLIPKVILEDPQTQEYRDKWRRMPLSANFGVMAHRKNPTQLDQTSLKMKQRGGSTPRIKRIFYNSIHKSRRQRQGVRRRTLFPCLSWTIYETLEGEFLPGEGDL
jgi:hypothetical protein